MLAKIDSATPCRYGAIAAYLAGRDMKSWAAQSFIGYRGNNGTLSVAGRSDMSWKKWKNVWNFNYFNFTST